MLSQTTRDLVKATAPVLQQHGETLTRHFYARMFQHNPEMKQIFNQGHQRAGSQQQALAMAVTAYAQHIEDPSVLMPVLTMVANKHISLGVRAEHYAIVGKHLLAAISEVLGAAASDELIDAWGQAYAALADTLIGLENQGYQQAATQEGGWSGWRGFRVARKVPESDEITSFYLEPADGGRVPGYKPGQYISLRLLVPQLGYMQPRQYSLSAAPGGEYLRISVKREADKLDGSGQPLPDGMVSNLLHDTIEPGAVLDLAPPAGDFFLHQERSTPVVLLSAGVGITPMLAMLEQLVVQKSARRVAFLHACRHGGVHAFKARLHQIKQAHPGLVSMVYYETPRDSDRCGADFDYMGRIDLAQVPGYIASTRVATKAATKATSIADHIGNPVMQDWPMADADYYLCGPASFMQAQKAALLALGVAASAIHLELFGTGGFAQ